LDDDIGEVLHRVACYLLDTVNRFYFLLDFFGDQVFYVSRRRPGVHGRNVYLREYYLGEVFLEESHVCNESREAYDDGRYIDSDLIVDRPAGRFKLLFDIFHTDVT